ncbi:hypothetical protein BDZ94DRAFT_1258356 [Collybia nuda]|uniref:Uncharacterized protein n=1 Tax=Collybia nuda TaxID=64659 RepID=A0A9P5Y7P3_9AGAR|nr:hypothetical protein BDZ94DRAFT_1258356 [Collybia nuda]
MAMHPPSPANYLTRERTYVLRYPKILPVEPGPSLLCKRSKLFLLYLFYLQSSYTAALAGIIALRL